MQLRFAGVSDTAWISAPDPRSHPIQCGCRDGCPHIFGVDWSVHEFPRIVSLSSSGGVDGPYQIEAQIVSSAHQLKFIMDRDIKVCMDVSKIHEIHKTADDIECPRMNELTLSIQSRSDVSVRTTSLDNGSDSFRSTVDVWHNGIISCAVTVWDGTTNRLDACVRGSRCIQVIDPMFGVDGRYIAYSGHMEDAMVAWHSECEYTHDTRGLPTRAPEIFRCGVTSTANFYKDPISKTSRNIAIAEIIGAHRTHGNPDVRIDRNAYTDIEIIEGGGEVREWRRTGWTQLQNTSQLAQVLNETSAATDFRKLNVCIRCSDYIGPVRSDMATPYINVYCVECTKRIENTCYHARTRHVRLASVTEKRKAAAMYARLMDAPVLATKLADTDGCMRCKTKGTPAYPLLVTHATDPQKRAKRALCARCVYIP